MEWLNDHAIAIGVGVLAWILLRKWDRHAKQLARLADAHALLASAFAYTVRMANGGECPCESCKAAREKEANGGCDA